MTVELCLRIIECAVAAALLNVFPVQRAIAVGGDRQIADEYPVGWILRVEQLSFNK
jgi:hypothetical protein